MNEDTLSDLAPPAELCSVKVLMVVNGTDRVKPPCLGCSAARRRAHIWVVHDHHVGHKSSISSWYIAITACRRAVPFGVYSKGFDFLETRIIYSSMSREEGIIRIHSHTDFFEQSRMCWCKPVGFLD